MVKQAKKAKSEAVVFTKRLSGVTFSLTLMGLGLYAFYLGRTNNTTDLYAAALIFAGTVNICAGAISLYRVLMLKEN